MTRLGELLAQKIVQALDVPRDTYEFIVRHNQDAAAACLDKSNPYHLVQNLEDLLPRHTENPTLMR